MASGIYNRQKYNWMKKLTDLSADTMKVILLSNSHSFNPDHNVLSDISGNEITGTGYTSGGITLSGQTVTQDDTNNLAYFDADDVEWGTGGTATFTTYHGAIINSTVSDNLVASIDFGGAKTVSAGVFTISWASTGIIKIT